MPPEANTCGRVTPKTEGKVNAVNESTYESLWR